jgi:tetratricopeptide (TPR) repeat protein
VKGALFAGVGLAIACAAEAQVTFTRDVAPIVFEQCASCHHDAGSGPFPLTSYQEVRQRASQIADVTARRVMPPWKPRGDATRFAGARVLAEAQIATIGEWVAQGTVEGNASELPPLPEMRTGWQLGTPDVVVQMPQPYLLRADAPDVFRTFVLPIRVDTGRWVRAVEFNPGNARAVHHANLGIDRTRSSRHQDSLDAEIGYEGGMAPEAEYPAGHMLGWTPGQRPRPSPDGAAWRLDPRSDVVVQLHLQPTGKPEPVQVRVGLYFTDQAPTKTPVGIRLGSQTIDIEPGNAAYAIADSYRLPVDVDVLAIQPHAHNLGRTVRASAVLPDGTTRTLIDIDDWDFRWQDVYRYIDPIALPRGTVVSMRFTYDNSAANVRNPNHPPARVVWGQNTSNEMGDLWIQVIPRSPADLAVLFDDVERKKRTEDIAGYTKILLADPNNPVRHDHVAMLLLSAGQLDQAIGHMRESLKLDPKSAPTHYNLGLALSVERKLDQALAEFREAVRLDPDHADANNNAGAMLHLMGRRGEAASYYRRAIQLRPDNADARSNLGRLYTAMSQDRAAADEFRKAIDVRSDHASALAGLAWVLATSPDAAVRNPQEAVGTAEQAAALTGNGDPAALDTLGAAYAAVGDFARATATAERALTAASKTGNTTLVQQIRSRLRLYRGRQPYLRAK